MKLSVLDENPVSVITEGKEFKVGPAFLGSRRSDSGVDSGSWAIVALSRDPLSPPRFISGEFPNAQSATRAFRDGFDAWDPAKEPSLTASKIVAGLLKNPRVKVG